MLPTILKLKRWVRGKKTSTYAKVFAKVYKPVNFWQTARGMQIGEPE